jgi:signal transduction histidine kinase/CheY-like chemotaxis protein
MASSAETPVPEQDDLQVEIGALKRELLPASMGLVLLVAWLWLADILYQQRPLWPNIVPLLIFLPLVASAQALRKHSYRLACALLLTGLVFCVWVFISVIYFPLAIAYGILIVVLAGFLLGPSFALGIVFLLWGAVRLASLAVPSAEGFRVSTADALALCLVTWITSWLVERPLSSSVQTALAGWVRAREALEETRQRRAELYRAVHALDEATSRLKRTNSELVLAQYEAEEARALKARFAATISHELRSPLNLILGFSRLLALSPESYPEALPTCFRDDVYTIYRSCQHLLALVDDILDLSQVEAQSLPLVKDRIDLAEDVIMRVMQIVEPLALRKGLTLRADIAPRLPWVVADAVRLRQAMLNLCMNAIRFTNKGAIAVNATQSEGYIQVSIRDSGPGIPQENLPHLFREFSQVRSQDPAGVAGSGLGLAISKHLVELHGGEVWVVSEPGRGSTFSFSVPLPSDGSREVRLRQSTPSLRRAAQHAFCLLVHDDADITRLLTRHITKYRVISVPDAKDLSTLIIELHPRSIITTPQRVPEVTEEIARTPYDVPVITCALPSVHEQPHWGTILAYLVKPISPEMVSAVMSKVARDRSLTVMLVDDDPDTVRLLETMLTALPHPYTILKAYDGRQAIEMLHDVVPDIVFLDLVMPEFGGDCVLEDMRSEARLREVPVVIISAQDWIGEDVMLGRSFHLEYRHSVGIAGGVAYLQAMLDAISPDYVTRQVFPSPLQARSPDRSVSAEQPPPPKPLPDEAD